MSDDGLKFPEAFHYQAGIGHRGSNIYFGTDVLSGLVAGMEEFLTNPDGRWTQYRSLGAAVLGCVPWLDDPPLLSAIDCFPRPEAAPFYRDHHGFLSVRRCSRTAAI
ncbi:hypothetical protein [Streptomyces sp. NPDC001089]